jgi:predicted RNA-binding protein associated with RNAse of E/G family
MTNLKEVTIEYIRPGKDVNQYIEDLVFEDDRCIKTFKEFPDDVAKRLTLSLQSNGFITKQQNTTCISKVYFFHEHFNVLQFQDQDRQTIGYYSDVGTPLIKTATGYQMTDWFLDIWLTPGGKLFELDLDEFEVAMANQLLTTHEGQIARDTFARLIDEVKRGIYPNAYL